MLEHDDHGVADWPFGSDTPDTSVPTTLPDGRPWPSIHILTPFAPGTPGQPSTDASVAAQNYQAVRHHNVPLGAEGTATVEALLADPSVDYLLVLRAGDLLAPGALTALALEAFLAAADVVTGLRVVFGGAVLGLDAIAQGPGNLDGRVPTGHLGPFTGGECLLSRKAVNGAGGLDLTHPSPVADLWPRLSGARLARVGRPVLLQHAP